MDNIDWLLYFLFNFFLYGVIGWIIENIYSYFTLGHIQEDGFLNLPFKPMYAIAMSVIVFISDNFNQNAYLLVFICFLIPTFVEYTTGILMRNYFNKNYWDYSNDKYNFQGIVCLKFSIYWTILTFIGVKYLQVYIIDKLYERLNLYWIIAAPIFILVLIFDIIFTIRVFKIKEDII